MPKQRVAMQPHEHVPSESDRGLPSSSTRTTLAMLAPAPCGSDATLPTTRNSLHAWTRSACCVVLMLGLPNCKRQGRFSMCGRRYRARVKWQHMPRDSPEPLQGQTRPCWLPAASFWQPSSAPGELLAREHCAAPHLIGEWHGRSRRGARPLIPWPSSWLCCWYGRFIAIYKPAGRRA